jgi:hypothetical protein
LKELIESYEFGRIVIDGVVYTSDVIVTGEKVATGWWRKQGHLLHIADIDRALEEFAPQVVIIGTGYDGMMRVPEETRQYFRKKGVELVAEKTERACELFNSLAGSKRTLAALHLTC